MQLPLLPPEALAACKPPTVEGACAAPGTSPVLRGYSWQRVGYPRKAGWWTGLTLTSAQCPFLQSEAFFPTLRINPGTGPLKLLSYIHTLWFSGRPGSCSLHMPSEQSPSLDTEDRFREPGHTWRQLCTHRQKIGPRRAAPAAPLSSLPSPERTTAGTMGSWGDRRFSGSTSLQAHKCFLSSPEW